MKARNVLSKTIKSLNWMELGSQLKSSYLAKKLALKQKACGIDAKVKNTLLLTMQTMFLRFAMNLSPFTSLKTSKLFSQNQTR